MNVTAIVLFALLLTGWSLLLVYARRRARRRGQQEQDWADFARWHGDMDRKG